MDMISLKVMEYLIHSGADLDKRDSGGDTPLHAVSFEKFKKDRHTYIN